MKQRWDEDQRRMRLMEWLTTLPQDREPSTLMGLADEIGVSPRTLRDWKADRLFRDEWEKRAREIAGEPERVQMVLAKLYETALDPEHRQHVSAATTFLKAVGAIAPPKAVSTQETVENLSSDELEALIAEGAKLLAADRARQGQALVAA